MSGPKIENNPSPPQEGSAPAPQLPESLVTRRSVEKAVDLVTSDSPGLRIVGLGQILLQGRRATKFLEQLAASGDEKTKAVASMLLDLFKPPVPASSDFRSLEEFRAGLEGGPSLRDAKSWEPNEGQVYRAMRELMKRDSAVLSDADHVGVSAPLGVLLDTGKPGVAHAAARALLSLQHPSSDEVLRKALKRDPELGSSARNVVLGSIEAFNATSRLFDMRVPVTLTPEIIALAENKSSFTRRQVVEILGDFNTDEAIKVVSAGLKDTDVTVREAAAKVLAKGPQGKYEQELLPMLQDPSRHVRVAALPGLKRRPEAVPFIMTELLYRDPDYLLFKAIPLFAAELRAQGKEREVVSALGRLGSQGESLAFDALAGLGWDSAMNKLSEFLFPLPGTREAEPHRLSVLFHTSSPRAVSFFVQALEDPRFKEYWGLSVTRLAEMQIPSARLALERTAASHSDKEIRSYAAAALKAPEYTSMPYRMRFQIADDTYRLLLLRDLGQLTGSQRKPEWKPIIEDGLFWEKNPAITLEASEVLEKWKDVKPPKPRN